MGVISLFCYYCVAESFWGDTIPSIYDREGGSCMKIEISQQALKWFKDELEVKKGDYVRFFAKIYGNSPIQPGYALGFSKDDPIDIAVRTDLDGIVFFVEETDLWYFDGHDLHIEYNEKIDEIEFNYIKP